VVHVAHPTASADARFVRVDAHSSIGVESPDGFLWDMASGAARPLTGGNGAVLADGRRMATPTGVTPIVGTSPPLAYADGASPSAATVSVSPDGALAAVADIMGVTVYDTTSGASVCKAPVTQTMNAWIGNTELVVLHQSGDVKDLWVDGVYDAHTCTFKRTIADHLGVWSTLFPDGRRLLTHAVSWGIWDLETGQSLGRLTIPEVQKRVPLASQDAVDSGGAIAVSPDQRSVVFGTSTYDDPGELAVMTLPDFGLVRRFHAHDSDVTGVLVAPDGQHVFSTSEDGTLRRSAIDGSGGGVTMFARAGDWIVYGDDGYFDASRDGGRLVAAVVGMHGFRIDQLAVRLNRPDIVLARLGVADDPMLAFFRGLHDRRLAKMKLTEAQLGGEFDAAPTASIADVAVDGARAKVAFDVASPRGALARYVVYDNGVPIGGAEGTPTSGARQHLTVDVDLVGGANKIEVSAFDASGVESLRSYRTVTGPVPASRELYFLGFGVSHYKDSRLNLQYAHKDAEDLGKAFAAMKAPFAAAHVKTYIDDGVTVANLRAARAFLQQAKTNDTVVLFVAGHGTHSRAPGGDYYYATYDIDLKDIEGTAANFEIVEDLLQGLDARQKLFLMDTCESGDRDDDEVPPPVVMAGGRGLVPRAFVLDAAGVPSAPAARRPAHPAPARPFVLDRDRYIYNDLFRRSGAVVFSSSRGAEVSFEGGGIENGVFTLQVVQALATGAADTDHDGQVSMEELRLAVERNVASMTRDLQHPTIDRDNLDARIAFPLAK
jgi:hypothetical protein